jgi:hypothetical protein
MAIRKADRPTRPRAKPLGNEVEITPEMIEAGAELIAHRFETPLDWLTRDFAQEIYSVMVRAKAAR